MIAPSVIPTPATVIAKAKPARPASESAGSLKVFRFNKSAIKVRAVNPPL